MDEDQSTPPAAASTTKKRNRNRRKKSTQGQQDQPLSSDDEMQTEPPSSNLNVAAEDESSNNQEDPFQSLIGNLKKLSLVPRSVTAKSKTQATTTAVSGVSTISDNNSNVVSQAIPSSLPYHPKPIVTISKTESWTTSNSSFISVSEASDQASTCKSLAKATSSVGILAPKYQGHLANSGGVWSKDKILALYKARVPERAKEAEKIWKEARALRAAVPKGEGMVVEDLDMEV
ncbi:hypothetical protein HDU99_002007 [Rhizoclosmatium hyalinum]|nr:hypothetical protein HDU99_002007 [Rhizoclosmatium hyalinum]